MPEPLTLREKQDLLSRTALGVFRLNGQFLAVSEELAKPAGLTAARWQVLGAVLTEPLPVAGIARAMGITRQSVQRIADLLAAQGLAEYVPNPAHRRQAPAPDGGGPRRDRPHHPEPRHPGHPPGGRTGRRGLRPNRRSSHPASRQPWTP